MNTQTNANTNHANTGANDLANRYLAIWNEHDAARRRALITEVLTEDASYLDPLMRGQGHSGIDAMIQAAQNQFAGLTFRLLDKVDAHNNHMRFSWELAAEGGPGIAGGTDFVTIAADGRLQSITGFLDFVPDQNA